MRPLRLLAACPVRKKPSKAPDATAPSGCYPDGMNSLFHLAFNVRDLDQTRRFYGDVLGCKEGRSTAKEGILGKVKRFADGEAVIIGIEELYRNGNAAETNALGHTERSTAAAGLVAAGTLGALVVRAEGYAESFKIGTGYTAAQRDDLWRDRSSLIGRTVKFKHQPAGAKDAPRFPVHLGFRLD